MNTQYNFSDLPKLSIYRYENFLNIYKELDGTKFYNILRSINIFGANDSSAEDQYIVNQNDTWYFISYKYYNTIDLWWLVCEYNRIQDATKMPEPGTIIKLLRPEYVWAVMNELNRQVSN